MDLYGNRLSQKPVLGANLLFNDCVKSSYFLWWFCAKMNKIFYLKLSKSYHVDSCYICSGFKIEFLGLQYCHY